MVRTSFVKVIKISFLIRASFSEDLGRVDGVFVFNTTDEVTWSYTNIGEEVLLCGPGVVTDLGNLGFQCLANILLKCFKLGGISPFLFDEHATNNFNGVAFLTHASDLLLGTVGDAGVGHGVTVITIGKGLEIDRSVLYSVGTSPLDGFFDHEDVLSLNLEAWDLVSSHEIVCVV